MKGLRSRRPHRFWRRGGEEVRLPGVGCRACCLKACKDGLCGGLSFKRGHGRNLSGTHRSAGFVGDHLTVAGGFGIASSDTRRSPGGACVARLLCIRICLRPGRCAVSSNLVLGDALVDFLLPRSFGLNLLR